MEHTPEDELLEADRVEQKVSFYFPNGLFIVALVIEVTVIFQALGLSFARNGTVLNGERVTASVFFSHLNFSQYQFFLIGIIPTVLTVLFALLAILYSKTAWFKYASIIFFAAAQFLSGVGYTRFAFTNPTHTIYHNQAYKVNAIDLGILTGVVCALLVFLFALTVLVLQKKRISIKNLHHRQVYIAAFLFITIIAQWVVAFTPLIEIAP
jgi:hypothetical protein